jgi:hypothetical protein
MKSSILSNQQLGFRSNSSIELASFKLINELLKALNSKIPVDIFYDLRNAFDCVNHDVLLSKLKFCGLVRKANTLVESYLHDSYQKVVIDKRYTHSSWVKVINGVPYGWILGPLLFLLYVNDLPNIIKSETVPFFFLLLMIPILLSQTLVV